MIVTFPFVLLLCDFWPLGRMKDRSSFFRAMPLILEKIPFIILSIGSCIVTALAQKAGGAMYRMGELPLLFRIGNSLTSYMEYIVKTLWPMRLSFFYPLIQGLPFSRWKLVIATVLLLCVSAFVVIRMKKQPFLMMGWLWFLGMLVPVIGLVQVGSQAMADRYTYLPLIGLFILISWLFYDLAGRSAWLRTAVPCGCVIVLVFFAFQTRTQAGYWKNDLTLSDHALAVTKYNFLAHSMKGIFYYTAGDFDKALDCYRQLPRAQPRNRRN